MDGTLIREWKQRLDEQNVSLLECFVMGDTYCDGQVTHVEMATVA